MHRAAEREDLAAGREPVVLLRRVALTYPTPAGPLPVLQGIDLRLARGESVALVGPSGSGKSTVLRVLAARQPGDAGTVTLLGRDPATLDDDARAALRRAIGMVDQGSALIDTLTVRENVLAPLAGLPRTRELLARVDDLLDRLRLTERASVRPARLSGGERQRVAIARALAGTPALLLADEPTGHQDMAGGVAIADLLLGYTRAGAAVVLATHDLALAARASRAYRLVDGRLVPVAIRRAEEADQDDAGAGLETFAVVDLDAEETAPLGMDAPTGAAQGAPGVAAPVRPARRQGRGLLSSGLVRVGAGTLAAVLIGAGGGAAIRGYLTSRQQEAAAGAAARALALEQQVDLRARDWPQALHDPMHSGRGPAAPALAGRRAWTRPFVGPVIASPVVADGDVYAGGTDGYLHALDARDGRERWRFAVGAELVNTTPAVRGGLVYTGASGGTLFALDRRSGRPRWSAALRAEPTAPPVVAGGLVLAVSGPATLQALDAASGRLRWLAHPPRVLDLGYPTEGAATVRDGVVYEDFSSSDTIVALRLSDGRLLWQFGPVGDRLGGAPAVDDTTLYAATESGTIIAVDRASRRLRWYRVLPPGRTQGVSAAPVRVSRLLLVPDQDGSLYALDSASGRLRWKVATGAALLGSPALSGGLAYQPSTDGRLYAVDPRDGRVRWTLVIGQSRGTPALAGGRLYVSSLGLEGVAGRGAVIAVR